MMDQVEIEELESQPAQAYETDNGPRRQQVDAVDSTPDLEAVRRRLASKDAGVLAAAERELGSLKADHLISLMALESRHRSLRKRRFIVGICLSIATALIFAFFAHSFLLFNVLSWSGGAVAGAMAFSKAHKRAAIALTGFDDVQGVGALLTALEISDPAVQSAVRGTLTRLLPRLRASDAGLLDEASRRVLRTLLASRPNHKPWLRDVNLVISTLHGLEQVGDESFLMPVERLAKGDGIGSAPPVRLAAERCLPYLKQRVENERLRSNLLRAAPGQGTSDPNALLRAVQPGGHTDPNELLRPNGGQVQQ